LKNKRAAGLDNISFIEEIYALHVKPLLELVSGTVGEDIFLSTLKKSVVKPAYIKRIK
jgi:hypothetical protein